MELSKFYKKDYIAQPFEELQSWNLELKVITPTSITDSHFGTMAVMLEFLMSISLLFKELLGWNFELKLNTRTSITDS